MPVQAARPARRQRLCLAGGLWFFPGEGEQKHRKGVHAPPVLLLIYAALPCIPALRAGIQIKDRGSLLVSLWKVDGCRGDLRSPTRSPMASWTTGYHRSPLHMKIRIYSDNFSGTKGITTLIYWCSPAEGGGTPENGGICAVETDLISGLYALILITD